MILYCSLQFLIPGTHKRLPRNLKKNAKYFEKIYIYLNM